MKLYLQECIIVAVVGLFAYDDGRLVLVHFEDDELGGFGKFELLECFSTRGINNNTRARLLVILRVEKRLVTIFVMEHVSTDEQGNYIKIGKSRKRWFRYQLDATGPAKPTAQAKGR
jgi:hypothetical protein